MDSLWKRTFEDINDASQTPKEIVQYQCEALAELTQGKVIARISEFDKPRERFMPPLRRDSAIRRPLDWQDADWQNGDWQNPQSVLGESEDVGEFGYEFYFTSRKTPQYKFRVFLMYHDLILYPVTLFLENGLCQEIRHNIPDFIQAEDEQDFTALLAEILNSDRVTQIVESLMKLNKD